MKKYLHKKVIWKTSNWKPVEGTIVAIGKNYYRDLNTGKLVDTYFMNFDNFPLGYGVWLLEKDFELKNKEE